VSFRASQPLAFVLSGLVLAGSQFDPLAGRLPTYDPHGFCSLAQLLPATVHVQPDVDPPSWIVGREGDRIYLEWAVGFQLGVAEGVGVVYDAHAHVVARDGGVLTGAYGGASERGDAWFAVCGISDR
jgi:hypothetical protein